jgi:hypothetical protein
LLIQKIILNLLCIILPIEFLTKHNPMKTITMKFFPILFFLVISTGCGVLETIYGPGSGEQGDKKPDDNGTIFPFADLGIPKGHLPPPGECKIWIPGKEPGQQGPPMSCSKAFAEVPIGAWVITHTGKYFEVSIFNTKIKGRVDEVRNYMTE